MKTVLVADDEFDLARTLRAILEGEGYRVETCGNGRQVLECLQGPKADLVLLDVMMPGVSGLEVLRAIKGAPDLAGIPVVLMSAVPPKVSREDYRWDVFLRKPFTIEALVGAVEGLIGKPEAAVQQ
jgi:CheY-like chemotaxis protein